MTFVVIGMCLWLGMEKQNVVHRTALRMSSGWKQWKVVVLRKFSAC